MVLRISTFVILLFVGVLGQAPDDGSLDDLIDSVFNPNKTTDGGSTTSTTTTTEEVVVKNPSNPTIDSAAGCTCVPYYLCNNGTINKDGTGIIDIRIDDGPCGGNYFEICCDADNRVAEPITPTPPPVQRTGCGYHNPDGVGFRITGDKDHESQFGEFPWMVAILREEAVEGNPQKLNVYQCGGALIHPEVVVTAAHCVNGKDKHFKIRAGEWDTQTKQELFPHQDREVDSVVVHPQFYKGALFNDIALLFLKEPVKLAENVDVICLPPQGTTIDNSRCYASGWGKDIFGKEGKYQVILKKIDLPIVNRNTCQEQLRTTRLGKFFELHNSFICAGGEKGKDTCKGDGGSPLVCPIPGKPGRYQHAGIVAWGIGCGENQIPGVYVNVPLFRSWIDEQLAYKNLDTSSYQY